MALLGVPIYEKRPVIFSADFPAAYLKVKRDKHIMPKEHTWLDRGGPLEILVLQKFQNKVFSVERFERKTLTFEMFLRLLIAIVLASLCVAIPLEHVSFNPPYSEVDASGSRIVNKYWRSSGTTEVMKSFIRLTPDRQSKRGSVWSRGKIGQNSISANVKFRISGQGKNFFGDGIGVWFTDNAFWSEGDLHGGQQNYVGVAIIFDTFKNTESLAQHRDVAVLINDGKKSYELMKTNIQGCNTNPTARYHNERADFQVTDASRAQIVIEGQQLTIKVDAKNTGEWQDCVQIPDLNLPSSWLANSFIGLTASTGQLADNHDVISLDVDSDSRQGLARVQNEKEYVERAGVNAKLPEERLYETNPTSPAEQRLLNIENALNKIMVRMQKMDLEFEHTGVSFEERIKNIIGKLSKREDESERRLDMIESIVKQSVSEHIDMHLDDRLHDHAENLRADLEGTVQDIASHIDKQVDSLTAQKEDTKRSMADMNAKLGVVVETGSSWKIPFFILLFLVIAGLVAGFQFRQTLLKKHFL